MVRYDSAVEDATDVSTMLKAKVLPRLLFASAPSDRGRWYNFQDDAV